MWKRTNMASPHANPPELLLNFDPDLKKRLQKSSNWKFVAALLFACLFFVSGLNNVLFPGKDAAIWLFGASAMAGWVWACADYMRSKGYSAIYGTLGLLGILGLAVLSLLPDLWKIPKEMPSAWPTNYPR